MIFHQIREVGKQAGTFRVLDMAFKRQITLGFGQTENGIKAYQEFQICGLFLGALHGAQGIGE